MSAKHAKRKVPSPTPAAAAPASAAATTSHAAASAAIAAEPSWLDSSDPKKRQWGKIILVAVWLYVAALWLLALDQWFRWGIFGPKVPPVP
jgi:hypothetical protein